MSISKSKIVVISGAVIAALVIGLVEYDRSIQLRKAKAEEINAVRTTMDTRYFYYLAELELILERFEGGIENNNAWHEMTTAVNVSKDSLNKDLEKMSVELPITKSKHICDSNKFYIATKKIEAQKKYEETLAEAYQMVEDKMNVLQKFDYLLGQTIQGVFMDCDHPYSKTARKYCVAGKVVSRGAALGAAAVFSVKTLGVVDGGTGLTFLIKAVSAILANQMVNWVEEEFASEEFKLAIKKEPWVSLAVNVAASLFAGDVTGRALENMLADKSGQVFSHAVPARYFKKIGLDGRSGLANSIWNGNYVSKAFHGATDSYAARFMVGVKSHPFVVRMLGRIPVAWYNLLSVTAITTIDGVGKVPMAVDYASRAMAEQCHKRTESL